MKNNNFLALIIIAIAALFGSKISLSVAWGAQTLSFSLFALLIPLFGYYLSLGQATIITSSLYILKTLFYGTPITLGIPTLAATASWAMYQQKNQDLKLLNFLLHVALPLSCMALFITHPIGKNAFCYSLYWLIPIAVYFFEQKFSQFIFLKALQSTFIAHAIGSIIWLYRVSMTAEQWLALIPLVAVERITFACAATLLLHLSAYIIARRNQFKNIFEEKGVSKN